MIPVQLAITTLNLGDVPDEWDSLTEAGRILVDATDRNRWGIGDLAARAKRKYGEAKLPSFARAIKTGASTVYAYHKVSTFYAVGNRDLFPALSWSHYRYAADMADEAAALAILQEASDREWSAKELQKAVKDTKNGDPVILQMYPVYKQTARIESLTNGDKLLHMTLVLEVPEMITTLQDLRNEGRNVFLTLMYEEEQAE